MADSFTQLRVADLEREAERLRGALRRVKEYFAAQFPHEDEGAEKCSRCKIVAVVDRALAPGKEPDRGGAGG